MECLLIFGDAYSVGLCVKSLPWFANCIIFQPWKSYYFAAHRSSPWASCIYGLTELIRPTFGMRHLATLNGGNVLFRAVRVVFSWSQLDLIHMAVGSWHFLHFLISIWWFEIGAAQLTSLISTCIASWLRYRLMNWANQNFGRLHFEVPNPDIAFMLNCCFCNLQSKEGGKSRGQWCREHSTKYVIDYRGYLDIALF